jgi:hypothetical protein
MDKILNQVEWRKPSLSLLSHLQDLIKDKPAVMIIRHSERSRLKSRAEALKVPLTARGKQAAYDFGSFLPTDRVYRIYHSRVNRVQETAEKIQEGIQSLNVKAEVKGVLTVLGEPYWEFDKILSYVWRDGGAFIFNWLSNRYPSWEIECSNLFAQRVASEIMNNLQTADSDTFDIYVSQAVIIPTLLFHWFGQEILPLGQVRFLEGFVMQFEEGKMSVIFNDGRKEILLPYWWKSLGF